jgi:hypothetical protein
MVFEWPGGLRSVPAANGMPRGSRVELMITERRRRRSGSGSGRGSGGGSGMAPLSCSGEYSSRRCDVSRPVSLSFTN